RISTKVLEQLQSDYNSTNIQLQVCRNNTSCAKMVFDVDIMLNTQSQNMAKVVGMKDLAKRLSNNFQDTMTPSIVVSATVENNTQNKTNISMNFPLNVTDYQAYSMYCVFWKTDMGQWSEVGCTQKFAPGNISICECDHLTSFSVLMSKYPISLAFLDELTYVGLGVSICSLLLFLFIEWLVWNAVVKSNLSHFRHTALVNIAICLLLADCSFLGSAYPKKLSGPWCLIFVIAKHFFFLAMFFWMLCLSMMLFHQLIFVFHHLRKKVFVVISLIVGYLCPAITVGATYVYYNRTSGSYYSPDTCWLRYEGSLKGSIYAFLFPVGTITIVNMFSMAVVIVTLLRPKVSEGNADQKETLKSIMKVIVFLTPVFGGTWVLGFFMFSSDNPNSLSSKLVTYAFTIVNSLQVSGFTLPLRCH
uniref:Adhesion G protein-coupled receptor F3b n=1 Tax=Denticeps clupeoides TaxID=299321 RepID=A0AAY4EZ99_9TELE